MSKAEIIGRSIAAILLFGTGSLLALDPPTREQLERYRQDGTLAARAAQARTFGNHRTEPGAAARLSHRLRRMALERQGRTREAADRLLGPPPSWAGLKTRGTIRILALLIAFPDYPATEAAETIVGRLFGDGDGGFPYESLRSFYRRSSYDQLTIEGDVLGWYTANRMRGAVVQTAQGRTDLIREAIDHYDRLGHDFTRYDNDGNGTIDYFCVFWTGPRGEWASFWWGYYTSFTDANYRVDNKQLTRYSWQAVLNAYPSGTFSPRTVIHETGHALGVPDFYDYDDARGPRGGAGGLDVMDSTAGDHGPFAKFMLEWLTPGVAAEGARRVALRPTGSEPDALLMFPNGAAEALFAEFFLIQNRHRTGNDSGLFTRADGVLVWHVDAALNDAGMNFRYDNSYTDRKLLRLMEADGLEQVETFAARADAGDYYGPGLAFGPDTRPSSARYSGIPTRMGLANFDPPGPLIGFDVVDLDSAPGVRIAVPGDGSLVYGEVTIEAEAWDDERVTGVELRVGGRAMGDRSAPPYTFTVDTRALANGPQTLSVIARDPILQTASASARVQVENILAPLDPAGVKVVSRALFLREFVNVLTWTHNPGNVNVAGYRIYRTGGAARMLLGFVPAGPSALPGRFDHRGVGRDEACAYEIAAVGSLDREGDPAVLTVR